MTSMDNTKIAIDGFAFFLFATAAAWARRTGQNGPMLLTLGIFLLVMYLTG